MRRKIYGPAELLRPDPRLTDGLAGRGSMAGSGPRGEGAAASALPPFSPAQPLSLRPLS